MKGIFAGIAVSVVAGIIVWYITTRYPSPNKPHTDPLVPDLSVGASGMGQEYAPAPAGYFVDPNTGRLALVAEFDPRVTFAGSGGTVASERIPPGTRFS